jgi:hypothetical protein
MSVSSYITIGWAIPTGLKVIKEKNGPVGHVATFSWNSDAEGRDISWRVRINNKSYIVKNNPIFTIGIPVDNGETCVQVQTIYESGVATSEYCDKVCIKNDKDVFCGKKPWCVKTKASNHGSARMRYARAINGGSVAAFR